MAVRPPDSRPGRGQWLLLLALLGGVIAFVAIWAVNPFARGQDEPEMVRYVEAVVGVPRVVNPLLSSLNEPDRDLTALVFSGLTRLAPDGQVLPDLADRWEISEDGLLYTFYLRPGVLWHDGTPFGARDVLFTYSLLADPQFPGDPSLSQFWSQVKCEAPDQFTVQCRLPEPFSPFLAYASIGILPSHRLAGTRAADLPQLPFNNAPVGTGPFRLLQVDSRRALLARNPAYHLGPPQIDQLELRFFPDLHAALTALHRGEVQGILLGPLAPREDLRSVASQGQFRLMDAPRTTYTAIFFNLDAPPVNDPRVREAISLLLDRRTITDDLLGGRAVPADTPIPPKTWAATPPPRPLEPDPRRAQQLLQQAGWQRGPDGLWRQGDRPVVLPLLTYDDPMHMAVAREVARQLGNQGLLTELQFLSPQRMLDDYLVPRRFSLALFSFDPGPDPDPYPVWHSSQRPPEGRNFSDYLDPEADRVLTEARHTADRARRLALYARFQELFREDVPAVVLFYPQYTYAVDERVQGISLGALFDPASRFASVWQWQMDPKGPPSLKRRPGDAS
mgnify:CR=1 FL=1